MTNEDVLNFIYNSFKSDWKKLSDYSRDSYECKANPKLKIIESGSEVFTESWATKFPNPNSRLYKYEIIFDGKVIRTIELVSLDGAQALLPRPLLKNNKINKYEYHVANIVYDKSENKRYLKKCGFELEE